MNTLLHDVRFALRTLLKERVFAAVTIATLALGIGANIVIFSMVNALLLRPLPVRNGARLVTLATRLPQFEYEVAISYQEYLDLAKREDVFSGLTGYTLAAANMNAGGSAERVWLYLVAPNYFSMLGVRALHGRVFDTVDASAPGASAQVVLNHAFWKRRFASDPSVVGQVVRLNGHAFTVVGIASPSFSGPQSWFSMDAYAPLTMAKELRSVSLDYRGDRNVWALGLLRSGVSPAQANAVLASQARAWEQAYGDVYKGVTISVFPEMSARPEPAIGRLLPRISVVFLLLTALVLSLACVNTTSLFMARSEARQGEWAIRRALGAGRGRLIAQVVTECLVIALPAGALGLATGHGLARVFGSQTFPAEVPVAGLFDARLDWRMLLVAGVLSVAVGVASGLATSVQLLRQGMKQGLPTCGSAVARRRPRSRLRTLLVTGQIAMATVVLVCGVLFVRSLALLRDVDLGFRTEGRLLASLDLGLAGYDAPRAQRFLDDLLRQVRALPAVRSASLTTLTPFGMRKNAGMVSTPQTERPPDEARVFTFLATVGTDYLRTAGMRLVQGRDFTPHDDQSSEAVAMVNEAAARQLWPGQDPIGKDITGLDRPRKVIAVVGDSKLILASEDGRAQVFRPFAQAPETIATLCVHSSGDPISLAPTLRALVRSMDPDVPLYHVSSFARHVDGSIAYMPARVAATFAIVAGSLGLLLALVGVAGIAWLDVRRRIPEIGLRMALGGRPANVVWLMARRGAAAAMLGVGLGVVLVLAIRRLLAAVLFGISPSDPVAIVIAVGLTMLTALAASLLPARRAARVDPMVALRCE